MRKGLLKIDFTVSNINITHFGGIFLIHRFCKKLNLRNQFQKKIRLNQRKSLYPHGDVMLAIIFAIIAGINRLSKTTVLKGNGAFLKMVGLKSFPYTSSLRRFLKRCDATTIAGITKVHDALRLRLFHLPRKRYAVLLDFDSTAVTIYGKLIEGAEIGYNPHKKGRRSYHPLLCFEYYTRDFWHGILRPGNAYTALGAPQFLEECLAKIPPYMYRIRARADSGFFDHKFIEPLDDKSIGYVIVAKLTAGIKAKLLSHGLRFRPFMADWSAAEFMYTPMRWKCPHRFVVIRRKLPEKPQEQPTLFSLERYSYQVLVTNLPLKAHQVWYFYRGRAAIEINIKELKQDYALTKIPTNSFTANQTFFALLLLSYNIVNWFKRLCLPEALASATLETIRSNIFTVPAKLVNVQHRNVFKFPASCISLKLLEQISSKVNKLKIRPLC